MNYAPFSAVAFDECHHTPAASYQTIAKHCTGAVFLGLTATPGRLDNAGLTLFNETTEPFGIVEATNAGWLVPIRAKRCKVTGIDLSGVHVQAGDFKPAELRAVLASEANLHAMALETMKAAEGRPCLGFDAGVDVAVRMTEIMNRYQPGCARTVHGKTPAEERRVLFADFGRTYQYLNNVDVATEGTDLPAAACLSMRRPTMSETVFQQQLGRVLRPVPGIDGAPDRAAYIAASDKPFALVLDFVGNSGKHSVQTAAAAYTQDAEVRKRVNARLAAGEDMDVAQVVRQEAERVARLRRVREDREAQRAKIKVSNVQVDVDDIRLIGLGGENEIGDAHLAGPITPGQVDALLALGVPAGEVATLDRAQARGRICGIRAARSLASPAQLDLIARLKSVKHHWSPTLSKKLASALIGKALGKTRRFWK
jgi:superfamily II DNA or RNA helicase